MNPTANEKWDHNGTIHWGVVSTQQTLPFQGLCLYITMSHEKIKTTQRIRHKLHPQSCTENGLGHYISTRHPAN